MWEGVKNMEVEGRRRGQKKIEPGEDAQEKKLPGRQGMKNGRKTTF